MDFKIGQVFQLYENPPTVTGTFCVGYLMEWHDWKGGLQENQGFLQIGIEGIGKSIRA